MTTIATTAALPSRLWTCSIRFGHTAQLWLMVWIMVSLLAACGTVHRQARHTPKKPHTPVTAPRPPVSPTSALATAPVSPVTADDAPPGTALVFGNSRWQAVDWADLPGFADDDLFEAWNAWIKSCERPHPAFVLLCADIRRLSIGSATEQRQWMTDQLRPYRVGPLHKDDSATGLLTAYFEPELVAQRLPDESFKVPLYRPPTGLNARTPWFSRQQIDTLPEARDALRGHEIMYLDDALQAMVLHIQGSGRVSVTEPDGTRHVVRLAYAGHNGHPFVSIARWLQDTGLVTDTSWPGIQAWIDQNPDRLNELLWHNPRVVFFREEPLGDPDARFGPKGAQGVPLTPGRSIAVDPDSMPFGTPVWLASNGDRLNLQRLVLAQDTGSAIRGAVRADYFVGWGSEAGTVAGQIRQALRLWVLWPK